MGASLWDHIESMHGMTKMTIGITGYRDTVDQVPMVRIPNGGFRKAGFILLEGRDSGF